MADQPRPVHILCDMDGTLVDTEGLKDEAWRRAVGEVSGTLPDATAHRALYVQFAGQPGLRVAEQLIKQYGLAVSARHLWEIRERHRKLLYSDPTALRARACAPVIGLVRRFRDGIAATGHGSVLLVTTAERDQVDTVFAALGIGELFDEVICGLEKTPEDPACYRAALVRLGCQPQDCLALEDSVFGYRAALSLGIPCLFLPNDYTRRQRL